ncbi:MULTISPECIES: YitT family protein [Brevibacillus]|uniref:YitT family protein n=1 Tax=Brevibacillus TaxID=55080 RepID=UPI000B9A910B|nr:MULTISPECIES: YitT family protein [Brevibacillus]MBG9788948.1 membrane protein [Brevibacillus laterosporus]RFB38595.1 YitT family protein [Brevibacillus sp. VP]
MIEHRKINTVQLFKRAFFIILGSVIFSFGLEEFLIPNQVIDGGITGISIIFTHLTGWPIGLFLFLLNAPFLLIGYKQIGKTFALSTLFGVMIMSIATTLLHPVSAVTREPFLAAVYGGVFLGIGVGLVIRYGGSLDGTEVVAILFNRKTAFSVGEVIMFLNIFILGSAGFVFGWNQAMYSLLAYYIAYKMIEVTLEGFNESRSVWIISDKHREIGETLLARLGRGVTYLNGEGGYSRDNKTIIFTVITRLEEAKLKSIVEEWDQSAFLAIGNIHDVKGGRFKKKAIH